VFLSELRVEGAKIVAELGIEEAAAVVFAEPGGGVILAHRFAAPGFEVIANRLERRFIDAKEDFNAGQLGDSAIVVGPVGRIELRVAIS
jgi:hypothetical protein